MAFHIEIAPLALADIETAYRFIKKDSPEQAARWLLGITEAILSLEKLPRRCPLAPESAEIGQEVRLLIFGRRRHVYKVFFSIYAARRGLSIVRIFHVRHGARKKTLTDDLRLMMG